MSKTTVMKAPLQLKAALTILGPGNRGAFAAMIIRDKLDDAFNSAISVHLIE
jgi:hypothetical protein